MFVGPLLGSSPVKSIVQCLARKQGTDDFYTLKVCFFLMCSLSFSQEFCLNNWLHILVLEKKVRH